MWTNIATCLVYFGFLILCYLLRRTRHMFALFLCIGVVGLVGCAQSPQTIAYKTLASVGQGVDTAEKAYLDLVIKGVISTNSLPAIQKDYNMFQRDFGSAVIIAEGTTNAVAGAAIVNEANLFISETSTAK